MTTLRMNRRHFVGWTSLGLAPTGTATIASPAAGFAATAGTPITFTAGTGVRDPDGLPLTYTWTFSNGQAASGSTAQVTFTNAAAQVTGTLVVKDVIGVSPPGTPPTVTFSVQAGASPPVAVADSYTTPYGTQLSASVLSNDTNLGTSPTAQVVTNVAHGTLTLNANGSFTYTPTTGYSGADSFVYRVTNSAGTSNNATASITVSAPPLPTAANDGYQVAAGSTLNTPAPGVLSNDTVPSGRTKSAVLVSGPSSGSLSLQSSGAFTFTPAASSPSPVTFTYRVSDGFVTSANAATVTITVAAPTQPVAVSDTYPVAYGTVLKVDPPGVLANDSNVGAAPNVQLVTNVAHGTLALNANGGFTYTPVAGYSGPDSFVYTVANGTATSASATVSLTVANPAAPLAANDTYTTPYATVLAVGTPGVLGNDTGPAGRPLSAFVVSSVVNGTLSLSPSGNFTYTPKPGYSGMDSFTYQARDGSVASNNATVAISVSPPAAPVAAADSYTVAQGAALNVAKPGVLGNDTGPAGRTLTAQRVTSPTSGAVTLNPDGSFVYTPNVGFAGSDNFTYSVSDGTVTGNTVTVSIAVTAASSCIDNDGDGYSPSGGSCGPVDCNDNNAAIHPGAVESCGDGIDNDCDSQIDSADRECNGTDCLANFVARPVIITQASWGPDDGVNQLKVEGNQAPPGSAVTVFNAATGALLGTTTVDSTGSEIGQWEFEMNTNTPPCRVRVQINGATAERAVSNAPNCGTAPPPLENRPPTATINTPATDVSITAGQAVNFTGTGTDPDGKPMTYDWNFGGGAANSTSEDPGNVVFANAGIYTVTFTVRDSVGATASATRKVTVVARNRPPLAEITLPTGNVTITQGGTVDFAGKGSDPDGNPFTYNWTSNGVTFSNAADPAPVTFNTVGTFTVTLTVRDSLGATASVSRMVTVNAAPVLPISRAEWDDRVLEVRGSGAASRTTVILRNASTNVELARTTSTSFGTWRFDVRGLTAPPCTVRVVAGNRIGVRAVSDAPSGCVR